MKGRALQLSELYAVPFLDLPLAFSKALKKQLLICVREEARQALEEAIPEQNVVDSETTKEETDSALWQLLSLNSSALYETTPNELRQKWLSLETETQQKLCREALRKVLHPAMGPAFINGQPW